MLGARMSSQQAANKSFGIPYGYPADWSSRKLRDVSLKIGSGATPTGGQAGYLPKRQKWALVRSQNVLDRQFDETGLAYISDEQAASLQGVALREGDVLLNITGDGVTFARSCQIPESALPAVVNQHVSIIRSNPEMVDSGYVLAYLTHPAIKSYIEGFNAGGSRRAITKAHIESFEIPIPPLDEQRAVAMILGTLDEKIELNRRMNETLEAMARAIFKSWFVDFDPVHAKASGEPEESICQRLRLTPDLLALFPGRFQDSVIGEVPLGWRVQSLPEIIEVNPIRQLKKGVTAPYLDMANVPINTSRVADVTQRKFGSGSKFVNGDTLLARITPCLENGKTAFVDFLDDGQLGSGSTEFIVLRPKPPMPVPFAYFLCRQPEFRSFAIGHMAGTSGRQRVPNDCFSNYLLPIATKEILAAFGKISTVALSMVAAKDNEAKGLSQLRNAALPKLMSGEIETIDVERPRLV